MKRLKQSYATVAGHEARANDTEECVVRSAILVHSGDDGSPMEFQSGDGPITFDDERIQRLVTNHNAKIEKLAEAYGGLDKMPVGAYPPILDQHTNDSSHRINGRLASLLRFERRDVPGVGTNVACALAEITFLGREICERVLDGRIYHLSIGIDEDTDTLGETSTVIEPAAPGAMLLKRGVKRRGALMNTKRLKAHRARLAKIVKIQAESEKIQTELGSAKKLATLARSKAVVTERLTKLMRSGKLAPSEMKKFDLTRLAKLNDDAREIVLEAFEAREPIVHAGQRGTTDAADFSEIGKNLEKRQAKRLRAETIGDFRRLGKKLGEEEHEDTKSLAEGLFDPGAESATTDDAPSGTVAAALDKVEAALDEGDIAGAKAAVADAKEAVEGSDGVVDDSVEMAAGDAEGVQKNIDELNTQVARLAGMVSELMAAEKEEGDDLESEDDDDAEMAKSDPDEEVEDDEKKKLAEETKKDLAEDEAKLSSDEEEEKKKKDLKRGKKASSRPNEKGL